MAARRGSILLPKVKPSRGGSMNSKSGNSSKIPPPAALIVAISSRELKAMVDVRLVPFLVSNVGRLAIVLVSVQREVDSRVTLFDEENEGEILSESSEPIYDDDDDDRDMVHEEIGPEEAESLMIYRAVTTPKADSDEVC
ncbi:hypothetical protein AAC387_Pa08g1493 [Persea americana]